MPTRALATFVADAPPFGAEATTAAAAAVADLVACLLAGHDDPATVRVEAAARGWSTGAATVVGRADGLAVPDAALVNGVAAHALDFDDNFGPSAGHASAALVPALLALAESRDAGTAALLDAYLVGLEALTLVGDALTITHYERGWHSTSTIGTIGAAAAGARLLGLDAGAAARAIGLSTSMAGGSKAQFGTMAKPLHAGLAARNGLTAALLAAAGVTAAPEMLAGPWSFADHFRGAGRDPDYAAGVDRLAAVAAGKTPPAILAHGLKPKIHPNCASVHAALDAVLDLRREHGFAAADVESIETIVRELTLRNLMHPRPVDPMQARFSMPYGIAAALAGGGRLSLADFRPAAIGRPAVRELMKRVSMRVHGPGAEIAAAEVTGEPAQVVVTLRDGRRWTRTRLQQRGMLADPPTAEDRRAKLADCLAGTPFEARRAAIEAALAGLATDTPVRALTRLIAA